MPNHRNVYISLAKSMSKTGKFQLTPLVIFFKMCTKTIACVHWNILMPAPTFATRAARVLLVGRAGIKYIYKLRFRYTLRYSLWLLFGTEILFSFKDFINFFFICQFIRWYFIHFFIFIFVTLQSLLLLSIIFMCLSRGNSFFRYSWE